MGANGRVYDFRTTISNLTNVPPERQKVVGLLRGSLKLSNELDTIRFGNLSLKEGVVKFTMIGTPEDQSFRDTLRETENIVSLSICAVQHGLILDGRL
jgi:ubiquitin-like domain-containing CTD phosphatase 1